jgi:hypothetical protein
MGTRRVLHLLSSTHSMSFGKGINLFRNNEPYAALFLVVDIFGTTLGIQRYSIILFVRIYGERRVRNSTTRGLDDDLNQSTKRYSNLWKTAGFIGLCSMFAAFRPERTSTRQKDIPTNIVLQCKYQTKPSFSDLGQSLDANGVFDDPLPKEFLFRT